MLQLQLQITRYYFLSMSNLDGVDNLIDLKQDPHVFLPFFEPSYPF